MVISSAGGIPALISLLGGLPHTFALPIFVAQHLARGPSQLDAILAWRCRLAMEWAVQNGQPRAGVVHLVPPGMKLALTAQGFSVTALAPGARSWLSSGDGLIHSIVDHYGERCIGVALSGAMPAGVNGFRTIKARGGFTMAQDGVSCTHFEMPSAAIDFARAEIVMAPHRMAQVLMIIAEKWASTETETGVMPS